uniref:Cytochrome P450 n=1 Tax=Phaedon brassicae TaxID=154011 RepID=A0A9Y1LRG3_9CUCU|nr:cytochrome P450 [Phaedon brassicae]
MLIIILCSLILYLLYSKFITPVLYWRSKKVFHTKPWGRFIKVFFSEKSFYESIIETYRLFPERRYFGSYQFLKPSLFVRDLDLIKQITVKDFEYFPDHFSFVNRNSDPILGQNLFSLEGEQWRHMRSTLSPAFTSSKMKSMYFLIKEAADNFVNHLHNHSEDVVQLEMKNAYSKFANDVIATCAFGVQCDSLKNDKNEFFVMGSGISQPKGFAVFRSIFAAFFPHFFEIFRIPIFPRKVTEFFQRLVKETISMREKEQIIRPDMIHLLMEAKRGRLKHEDDINTEISSGFATVEETYDERSPRMQLELTDDLITAQALVFFIAGFDTSSTLLSFLSYQLAVDVSIQLKLQEEIDDVIAKGNGHISYDSLLKMKYLDQVISETLRKYPAGFILTRTCVKDYKIEAKCSNEVDFILDRGTLVSIPVAGIHMNPDYFPEPDKFDPDRFSEENRKKILPGSYLPFGSGPRNCIGSRFALLECKTLIATLLARFNIVVIEKTPFPLRFGKTFTLSSRDGFWLGLKKRNEA